MLTATAAEIVVTDQPNSARSGSISTPGTARKAAAPTRARKVTAATHQAGWIRYARGGAGTITAESMSDRQPVERVGGIGRAHVLNPGPPITRMPAFAL